MQFGVNPNNGLQFIVTPDGEYRYLAALPTPPAVRSSYPAFSSVMAVVPRSEWREVSLEGYEPDIYDQNGHGCHTDTTEVLTVDGWKRWTDYDWKSPIGTMNPVSGCLEYQSPTASHIYEYDGEIYRSTNRCVDFAITPNHRLYQRKWNERNRRLDDEYSFVEVASAGWYFGLPHSTSGWLGTELDKVTIPGSLSMSGDDLIRLVAILVSDGWAGGSENKRRYTSFCCFDDRRYQDVAAMAHRLGFMEQADRRGVWYRNDIAMAEWVRQNLYVSSELGAYNKCVPALVRFASQRQIELYLEFSGDKNVTDGGNRVYTTTSPRLADDIQELLLKTGKRGSISSRHPRSSVTRNGRKIVGRHDEITVYERASDRLSIDKKKHLETERYKGTVFCATVPNGTIVTRYNRSVLVSGNSCVGHGAVGGLSTVTNLTMRTKNRLSPVFVYAQINGGRDQGAIVADSLECLQKTGACLWSTLPGPNNIYKRDIPESAYPEAKRFRIDKAVRVDTFDELVSAVLNNWVVVFGIEIGNNFDPDGDGFVPRRSGGGGGHCMYASGLKQRSGQWYARVPNSWGTRWGKDGVCFMPESYFSDGYMDAYAIQAAKDDPEEQSVPPVAG